MSYTKQSFNMKHEYNTMEKQEQLEMQNTDSIKTAPKWWILSRSTKATLGAMVCTILTGLLIFQKLSPVELELDLYSKPLSPLEEVFSKAPLIDGHNDFPIYIRAFYYNHIYGQNFTENATLVGQVDFPRLRQSRLGAQFWSAYVECPAGNDPVNEQDTYYEAMHETLQQIDLINRLMDQYPTYLKRASSASEVWDHHSDPTSTAISSLIGIEGLHQVANSASALRLLHNLGARYVTLTHSCHNAYADSCSPTEPLHGGLSKLGRDAVHEMNRLGLIVDLSHTSAATQRDAFEISQAPVVYTHSAARGVCDHERNVADEELLKLKQSGGVVMVNFFPGFVACGPNATLHDVADHVVYMGNLIGYRHVGIGADFDGMGFDDGPEGLEHVGKYPDLLEELLRRGVSVDDVSGVAGANILRVLEEVEQVSQKLSGVQPLEDQVKSIF